LIALVDATDEEGYADNQKKYKEALKGFNE